MSDVDILYLAEEWRPSVGNYEVSSMGRVRHMRTKHIRKPRLDPEGYYALNIWVGGRLVRFKIHVLVMEAFEGKRQEGMQIRHLNGVPTDNRIANLSWGTAKDNARDRERHGRTVRGEDNPRSKLTESDVQEIRSSSERGVDLARRYGVTKAMIGHIRKGRAWAWLPM